MAVLVPKIFEAHCLSTANGCAQKEVVKEERAHVADANSVRLIALVVIV